jgi:hypothetical protein
MLASFVLSTLTRLCASLQTLARWVCTQRKHYRDKKAGHPYHTLSDDKERRLVEVGFTFNARTTKCLQEQQWKRMEAKEGPQFESFMKKLVKFKEKYGHCAVPRRWKDKEMSTWVERLVGKRLRGACLRIGFTLTSMLLFCSEPNTSVGLLDNSRF